jgi:tRNA threonylcarbamoyl adenosine modification protein (Sua5/YciO/YrdC/YwlC family)
VTATEARDLVDEAVRRLRAGELVAFATETVFALGADAGSPRAVRRLREWKGRGPGRPLSILVSGLAGTERCGARVPAAARRLAEAFWPGPLTLVLPAPGACLAAGVARADGALGFRCSPHPVAAALVRRLEEAGAGPVTATSLNRTGQPPARSLAEARRACGGAGPWLLEGAGPDAWGQTPSSVADLTGAEPVLLREGPIGAAAIREALAGREARRA